MQTGLKCTEYIYLYTGDIITIKVVAVIASTTKHTIDTEMVAYVATVISTI